MGAFSIWHFLILFTIFGLPLLVLVALGMHKPQLGEKPATFKFRTIIYLALAFVIPLWPITFPIFAYLAFRSYQAGSPVEAT